MKISTNTIREMNQRYDTSASDSTDIGVTELVTKIGSQLGEVDDVTDFGAKFEGVIVARVVSCEKHPNADRLNVCTIDDGNVAEQVERNEQGYVRVVCGAPNVREGLTVAWLPPGSTVPNSYNSDPFVLSARELRGIVSNGMLASPKELSISDSHDGILEISEDITPGAYFADAFNLRDDTIIDIENKMFTHRPDCFGFLGVAREIAGIQGIAYKSPDWYVTNPIFPGVQGERLPLHIDNQLPEIVPRFTAIVMRNIAVGPSPLWLQLSLARVGVRSINNVVDLTNYYMLETGQPLHAYDYDKIKQRSSGEPTLVVRYPHENEAIDLLNGKTVTPRSEAVMIATDQTAVGIGGIMGGADTEVDNDTKTIILECANFNMYSIRRTSMANGLFTDAVTRFNKGQSPLQNLAVLAKIVGDVQQLAGGEVASDVIDNNQLSGDITERQSLYEPVSVSAEYVNARLGFDLSANDMAELLTNVEFGVDIEDQNLTVLAPFWRTDIEIREDVIEEIGRLYGFDKLPIELPTRVITPANKDELISFKTRIRKSLVAKGANELLTYSFVPGKLLENAGQKPEQAFKLSNALSPELEYYRLSVLPSLLEKVHPNIKAGYDHFALFELGKGHNVMHADDDDGLPSEFHMLDLVIAASDKSKPAGAAYYEARAYLDALAKDLGVELVYTAIETPSEYPVAQPYDQVRSAYVSDATGKPFGIIGEFTASTRKTFKLPAFSAGFNVSPRHLMQAAQRSINVYRPLSKYPKVTQDITLKIATDSQFKDLENCLLTALQAHQPEHSESSLELVSIYQKPDDTEHKQLTLRLTIANHERTLTDKVVSTLLDTVVAEAGAQLGAERV